MTGNSSNFMYKMITRDNDMEYVIVRNSCPMTQNTYAQWMNDTWNDRLPWEYRDRAQALLLMEVDVGNIGGRHGLDILKPAYGALRRPPHACILAGDFDEAS
jgi:hypothetical protein